jgi:hypothetical protein
MPPLHLKHLIVFSARPLISSFFDGQFILSNGGRAGAR